jgi:flagellar hook protein FlgE
MSLNLDARKDVPLVAMDFSKPDSYNFSTSQTLYDGQGAGLTMNYYFRKSATDSWDVYGSIDGSDWRGTAGAASAPNQLTSLSFDSDGTMTTSPATITEDIIDPRDGVSTLFSCNPTDPSAELRATLRLFAGGDDTPFACHSWGGSGAVPDGCVETTPTF